MKVNNKYIMGKFSARSSSFLNLKNLPSKSTNLKDGGLFSTTPIKIGEMELYNMFLTKDIKNVARFISTYSSNEMDRQHAIETMLTTDNVFNIDYIEPTNTKSKTSLIVKAYLKCIGLEIIDENQEIEEINNINED